MCFIITPAVRNAAPCRNIRPKSFLPSESIVVTPDKSTVTRFADVPLETSSQMRSSSSTQGPDSFPSSFSVAGWEPSWTVILSVSKNPLRRSGGSQLFLLSQAAILAGAFPGCTSHDVGEIGNQKWRHNEVKRPTFEDLEVQLRVDERSHDDNVNWFTSVGCQSQDVLPRTIGQSRISEDQLGRPRLLEQPTQVIAAARLKDLNPLLLEREFKCREWPLTVVN